VCYRFHANSVPPDRPQIWREFSQPRDAALVELALRNGGVTTLEKDGVKALDGAILRFALALVKSYG